MKKLRVLLLGPPEVHWEQGLLTIQRRYPRALLFYLASNGGMVGREELLTLFWENQSEDTARLRLRETLNKLHAALPKPSFLLTERDLVGLNFQQVQVDQIDFENICDRAWSAALKIPRQETLPGDIYQALNEAANLWHGPRFLAGVKLPSTTLLDDWLSRTSHRTEHLRGRILERLSDHAYVSGNLDESLRLARLALENNELSEDLHERVLRLLIWMDRRNEAREHFKYTRKVMRRELERRPSQKLFTLYQLTRTSNKTAPSTPVPSWHLRPSIHTPFVGRRSFIDQLNNAYKNGGAAIIMGESGLGKTRLLQEFITHLNPSPRLLLTRCRPNETNLPFQPIIDISRNSVQEDEWINFPVAWVSKIMPLVPDLAYLRSDLDGIVEGTPGHARALLFEAIRQMTAHLANHQRLMICLDDAQWADEATLAAIGYLLERPPFIKDAFLILAARREEHNPYLDQLLNNLEDSGRVIRLNLSRLTQEEIFELSSSVLGESPSATLIAQLALETGGNPFFILETLRTLLDHGTPLDLSSTVTFPFARSVYLLITRRLKTLSPQAREILEASAVIGAEFSVDLVVQALGCGPERVYQALDVLERQQLVEPLSREPPNIGYRFIHDKIREAILLEINPLKTRWLHGQIARGLENILGENTLTQAAVLAQHYNLAGEWGAAFDYGIKAGQRARQLFSVEEAQQAFNEAEKLIGRSGNQISDEQIHHLYAEWNELTFDVHDTIALRKQNLRLRQIGEERHSPLLIGTALNGMSDACMTIDQFEEGLEYSEQAIRFLESTSNIFQRMQAFICRGVFLYMLSRWEQAIHSFQHALELGSTSQESQVIRARANAHYQMALVRNLGGWPLEAREHAIKSLADHLLLGRTYHQVAGYSALSLAQIFLGEYRQALQNILSGLELAEKTQSWRMLGYLLANRAMYYRNTGNLGACTVDARRTIYIGEQYGHNDIIALGYRLLGDVHFYILAPEQAEKYYRKGLEIGGGSFLAGDLLLRLGHVLCQLRQEKIGKAYLQRVSRNSRETGLGLASILAQFSLASMHAGLGHWDRVYLMASKLKKETKRRSLLSLYLRSLHLLGQVALHNQEIETAVHMFETVVEGGASMGNPWIELKAQVMLDKTQHPKGDVVSSTQQRIIEILDQMETSISTDPESLPTQQSFQSFRQKIVAGIADV